MLNKLFFLSLTLVCQGLFNQVKSQKVASFQPVTFDQPQKVDVTIKKDPWENIAQGLRLAQEQKMAEAEKNRKWSLMRDTLISKAKIFINQSKFDSTLLILSPHETLRPNDQVFYGYLGTSYYHLGMYSAARTCLLTALELGKHPPLYFLAGKSYEKLGDEKEANKLYKKGAKAGDADCKLELDNKKK